MAEQKRMPEKFKRLSARLKKLSEHKRINIELPIKRSEGDICLPLWVRPQDSLCNAPIHLGGLYNEPATTATNIAAMVRATTIQPKRELD
jgi:hypothetical protein